MIDEATTGGDAADDDEMRRVGSLDSQIGDFGYIDDVDLGSGYALAGIKRNQEFHQLFDNVPEHDALIEGRELLSLEPRSCVCPSLNSN